MEKYTMFMDWKNQYSENEYTTQSNFGFTHKLCITSLQSRKDNYFIPFIDEETQAQTTSVMTKSPVHN